jgi:type II restriction/modification system DNA methylase subunit YeeA
MNRSALKKYAPQARLDFIEAVTQRARRLGLDQTVSVDIAQSGDVLLINGQPFPASIATQRAKLAQRIQQQGFAAVVEALAYTWFNRLVAIRFMELKGYLSHGYRVLSHPQGQQPEILDNVQHLDLPGLDKAEVIRLKTAGNQDEALYREILLAQCHELHRNMPFLFEALDDATELLLPDNLLRTDSPIARLVSDIEEDDWQDVEIIGWLYQFYISDKKDQVIGKVVKSEDIPAATQLFTPNWIVQYLVQNSLGRLWLMANPSSSLKEKMPYYIEPAEQTPEVQAQLDALIKVRMDEDGGTLNPESLTVLDPACGSGHILVEAYNLLRAIYEERGYRLRDIPRLILQKNIFGLDIDDRAAQLAGFALLMKAREDDRRLFDDEGNPPHLNVMAIQQSAGLPDEEIAEAIISAAIRIDGGEAFHSEQLFGGGQLETLHSSGLTVLDLRQLIQLFEHGKTFGSLISVPEALRLKLGKIVDLLASVRSQGDDLSRSYANQVLEQFAWPASLLALQYDAVVANPPYMGGKGMNPALKEFAKKNFPASKADLFAMFIEHGFVWCKSTGFNSMVTMQSWMFLSSYESMRGKLLGSKTVSTMVHMGNGVMGIAFGTAATVILNKHVETYEGSFSYCESGDMDEAGNPKEFPVCNKRLKTARSDDFNKIPGSPIAYWISTSLMNAFHTLPSLSEYSDTRSGLVTGDNEYYIRRWSEVSFSRVGFDFSREDAAISKKKWFPLSKGGEFRRWYGNHESLINWESDGFELQTRMHNSGERTLAHNFNLEKNFLPSISWTKLSSGSFGARIQPKGFVFHDASANAFPLNPQHEFSVLAFLCSKLPLTILKVLNPTLNFVPGNIGALPILPSLLHDERLIGNARELVALSKANWDSHETSWGFVKSSLVMSLQPSLKLAYLFERSNWGNMSTQMSRLEEYNNQIIIDAYGFQDDLSSKVDMKDISLSCNPRYRYGGLRTDEELELLLLSDTVSELVSYAIGCMMGRYSLDESGLIYAHSGNIGFDPSRYSKFPADSDGIIPITDESWFEDDAAERVREFVKVVWGADTLVENMEWLADSLGRKAGESADEAIRRYLTASFYKDHLQTYKKRPIYWLFSSGKQKAFECLVYLHRYNEGTLSRMRMEYVVPLQSRMQARIDKLTDDITSATSSAQQKALQKRKDKLTKQLEELRRFDETLRPYADQRITLDLDDGVKVNYGKFGNLLAEVKAITGGKED